jgi:hypothetical protein
VANVAEISVIVTGSVALGTPLINGWIGLVQGRRASRTARFDELRSVFDDAAQALTAFMSTLLSSPYSSRQDWEERVLAAEQALKPMSQQEARMAVRLGSDATAVKVYRQAHVAAGSCVVYMRETLDPTKRPEGELVDVLEAAQAASAAFYHVAATLIGPDR